MAIAAVHSIVVATPGLHALRWHVAAMIVGECLSGFFAVWTVHHGSEAGAAVTRTQRGRWINLLFYNMFYHAEHHLFPMVPTPHMAALARRIDEASSTFANLQVIPIPAAVTSVDTRSLSCQNAAVATIHGK